MRLILASSVMLGAYYEDQLMCALETQNIQLADYNPSVTRVTRVLVEFSSFTTGKCVIQNNLSKKPS